jgi:hypothetical protein
LRILSVTFGHARFLAVTCESVYWERESAWVWRVSPESPLPVLQYRHTHTHTPQPATMYRGPKGSKPDPSSALAERTNMLARGTEHGFGLNSGY